MTSTSLKEDNIEFKKNSHTSTITSTSAGYLSCNTVFQAAGGLEVSGVTVGTGSLVATDQEFDGIILNNTSNGKTTVNSHASASSITLTLPQTAGSENQVITTDGSGNLAFSTVGEANIGDPGAIIWPHETTFPSYGKVFIRGGKLYGWGILAFNPGSGSEANGIRPFRLHPDIGTNVTFTEVVNLGSHWAALGSDGKLYTRMSANGEAITNDEIASNCSANLTAANGSGSVDERDMDSSRMLGYVENPKYLQKSGVTFNKIWGPRTITSPVNQWQDTNYWYYNRLPFFARDTDNKLYVCGGGVDTNSYQWYNGTSTTAVNLAYAAPTQIGNVSDCGDDVWFGWSGSTSASCLLYNTNTTPPVTKGWAQFNTHWRTNHIIEMADEASGTYATKVVFTGNYDTNWTGSVHNWGYMEIGMLLSNGKVLTAGDNNYRNCLGHVPNAAGGTNNLPYYISGNFGNSNTFIDIAAVSGYSAHNENCFMLITTSRIYWIGMLGQYGANNGTIHVENTSITTTNYVAEPGANSGCRLLGGGTRNASKLLVNGQYHPCVIMFDSGGRITMGTAYSGGHAHRGSNHYIDDKDGTKRSWVTLDKLPRGETIAKVLPPLNSGNMMTYGTAHAYMYCLICISTTNRIYWSGYGGANMGCGAGSGYYEPFQNSSTQYNGYNSLFVRSGWVEAIDHSF